MTWSVVPVENTTVTCGSCNAPIAGGQPIALVTVRQLPRCVPCAAALGFDVDDAAVDAARHRLEAERLAPKPAAPKQREPEPSWPTWAKAGDLSHLFDPKAAAAGDARGTDHD